MVEQRNASIAGIYREVSDEMLGRHNEYSRKANATISSPDRIGLHAVSHLCKLEVPEGFPKSIGCFELNAASPQKDKPGNPFRGSVHPRSIPTHTAPMQAVLIIVWFNSSKFKTSCGALRREWIADGLAAGIMIDALTDSKSDWRAIA